MLGFILFAAATAQQPLENTRDVRCLTLALEAGQLAKERDEIWAFGIMRAFYLGRLSVIDLRKDWVGEAKRSAEAAHIDADHIDIAGLRECEAFQEFVQRAGR